MTLRRLALPALLLAAGLLIWFGGPALRRALAAPQTLLYVRCTIPPSPPDLIVDPAPIGLTVRWEGGEVSASLWDHCGRDPLSLSGYPTEAPVPATVEVRFPDETLQLGLEPVRDIQAERTGRAAMIHVDFNTPLKLEHDSL